MVIQCYKLFGGIAHMKSCIHKQFEWPPLKVIYHFNINLMGTTVMLCGNVGNMVSDRAINIIAFGNKHVTYLMGNRIT